MSFTIEYYDSGSSSWKEITSAYNYSIQRGVGKNLLAPKAKVYTEKSFAGIGTETKVRILIDGSNEFEGFTTNSGKVNKDGTTSFNLEHYGYEIMEEVLDYTGSNELTDVKPEDVLSDVLSKVSGYSSSDLTVVNSPSISYTIDFDEEAKVKKIFNDMMDLAGYVVRFTPSKEVIFEPFKNGDLGTLSDYVIQNYEPDDKQTVINRVVIKGTGGDNVVKGVAEDYTYIDQIREKSYNVDWVKTQTVADKLAQARLSPEPSDTGTLVVYSGDYTTNDVSNSTVSFDASNYNLGSRTAVVMKQTLEKERMVLSVGSGTDIGTKEQNREKWSDNDKNETGATNNAVFYDTDTANITGMSKGDIGVIDEDNNGTYDATYKYNGSEWVKDGDITLEHIKDGIFRQDTAPDHKEGIIWYDTNTRVLKRSTGSAWEEFGDSTQADKIIYKGSDPPSSPAEGDLWYDTGTAEFKRYDSGTSSWEKVSDITQSWETFSDETDIDVLLTTNAPAESGADETIRHSDDIIYRGSTAPSHQDGRLWYDTGADKFKESRGGSWYVVGDETALHETFSTEGDIDVLQTTNSPNEANADNTGNHVTDETSNTSVDTRYETKTSDSSYGWQSPTRYNDDTYLPSIDDTQWYDIWTFDIYDDWSDFTGNIKVPFGMDISFGDNDIRLRFQFNPDYDGWVTIIEDFLASLDYDFMFTYVDFLNPDTVGMYGGYRVQARTTSNTTDIGGAGPMNYLAQRKHDHSVDIDHDHTTTETTHDHYVP